MPCWCNGSAYRATNAEIRFKSCTGYLFGSLVRSGSCLPSSFAGVHISAGVFAVMVQSGQRRCLAMAEARVRIPMTALVN